MQDVNNRGNWGYMFYSVFCKPKTALKKLSLLIIKSWGSELKPLSGLRTTE